MLAALALAGCGDGCGGERVERPRDLVIVTVDTTRADHLGLYGYPRDTTPALERHAADAVVFDRHIVPMATTLPSHTSLFTATYPLEHGVRANLSFTGERFVVAPGLVPLAVFLHSAGYQTAGFVSASPLKSGSGIEVGFDGWDEPRSEERRADVTVDRALQWWADSDASRPRLLWVHLFDPHWHYQAPRKFRGRFGDDAGLAAWMDTRDIAPKERVREQAMEWTNAYDEEIAFMDTQLDRLLEQVRTPGAVVVLAGDHGEGLMQHKHMEHGLVWDEQIHAPLVMWLPGEAPRRYPGVVSTVDVLPTVAPHLAVPGVDGWLEQASGHDALAVDFPARGAFSVTSERQEKRGEELTVALTTDRWKFIGSRSSESLYDLDADPFELRDVAADHPAMRVRMSKDARERYDLQVAWGARLGAGETEAVPPGVYDELRALGYLE